ncbi:MAG: site-specific integrase [Oscillospiraceae bacterium]|nr:site-specific integrase [Oscillospiraceae bacterium]
MDGAKTAGNQANTWESYQVYLEKHIRPYFAPKKLTLSKLNPQHLQDYYNQKLQEGQAVNTLKKHHAVIHGALQEAVKKRLLTFNPADQVTFPRQNKQDRFHGTAYTAEQAQQLLEAFKGDVLEPAVILGLCYGLRKSEALGLRWSDIDFEAGTLSIQNTVTRMKTLIEHEQTKSAASKRVLYLMADTITYLRQLREQQEENQKFLGSGYTVSDHICVWPDGRPVSPDYVSQHFKRVLVKNNLQIIRFHDLRHTAGSLLMNNGATVKQVQEFLGHEKASTTLDIYTHIDTEAKQRTAMSMEQALQGDRS